VYRPPSARRFGLLATGHTVGRAPSGGGENAQPEREQFPEGPSLEWIPDDVYQSRQREILIRRAKIKLLTLERGMVKN
jgi:hypothetical protein